jgi:hypothetical protein
MTRALALLAVVALLLSGCSASATLPEGVTASVFQTRFDSALRQLQLRVTNDSPEAITVTSASLVSSRFVEPATFDRTQLVPAGSARDLPVLLGEPSCTRDPIQDAVLLSFEKADGTTGSTSIALDDTAIVTAVNDRDCLDASVATHATISAPLLAPWTPGAQEPATLDFSITPTGAAGVLTIGDARDTPLFGLVAPSGENVTEQAIDLVVDAESGPTVIRLRIVPGRCDPHAIAEDKQGTLFPFDVEASDGRRGRIVVAATDEVRASLYDYFADYCGLPY